MGPCLCGDTRCGSCGPAQGNNRCEICGKWDDEDGCIDAKACEDAADEMNRLLDEQEARYEAEEEATRRSSPSVLFLAGWGGIA